MSATVKGELTPGFNGSKWLLLVLFTVMLFFGPIGANATPTQNMVEEKLQQLETELALSDATKKTIKSKLQETARFLSEVEEQERAAQTFAKEAQAIPERIDLLQTELKTRQRQQNPLDQEDLSPLSQSDLQQRMIKVQAEQNSLLTEMREVENRLAQAQDRPQVIGQTQGTLATRLEQITATLSAQPDTPDLNLSTLSETWALEAERDAILAEQQALQQELLGHQSRVERLKARMALLEWQLREASSALKVLQEHISERRLATVQETQKTVTRKEQTLQNTHPLIKSLAARNTALSDMMTQMSQQLQKVEETTAEMTHKSLDLNDAFRSTQQKVELAGLTQALGQALLEERRRLPNTELIKANSLASQQTIAAAGLRQIQHEEERRALRNMADYINQLGSDVTPDTLASLRTELSNLAEQRLELLDKAIEIDQAYLKALSELDFAQREYVLKSEAFNEYLNERLLWVRSSSAINLAMVQHTPNQFFGLLNDFSQQSFQTQALNWVNTNSLYTLLLPVLLIAATQRTYYRRQMLRLGEPLQRLTTDQFIYTVEALFLTVVYCALWPAIFYLLGLGLSKTPEASDLSLAIADAFQRMAIAVFFIDFLCRSCLPNGLVATHFRWPKEAVESLRKDLLRFRRIFLPLLFFAFVVLGSEIISATGALQHVVVSLVLITFSWCATRLIRNPLGWQAIYLARTKKEPGSGTLKLLQTLFIGGPIFLIALSLSGYLYTSAALSLHILYTLMLNVSIFIVHQLILRWLVLTQRKLAFRNALERRNAARQKKADGVEETVTSEVLTEVEEPQVDLNALSQGSQELVKTLLVLTSAVGIWLIWRELLPAFGVFEDFSVWQYTETIDGEKQSKPVTLLDLALALAIFVITLLAAKRVPALVEFIFLQKVTFGTGSLYALRTLTGYFIVAVGTLTSLSTLGASWSQIQWLAAALSVGIGFGLQEIVANFISGLIILFERPIRVGDVVTVGDTDGIVTRIQIRATTIRNWEQKELLVPNKEFITSRLLNWTLSDQTNRLLIPIGIAYGSDVRKAMSIIANIAEAHPLVLSDPAPLVTFESFGDNALMIYLRAYVNGLDHRLPTLSDLHLEIYEQCNDAKIVIAFPQRDVHLDTSRPLEIQVRESSSATDLGKGSNKS
ncbi:mechanosensitive ion channel MscS [Oleiphilus messinensis]|uniref:Mechanosensitive ion channel MscS n=1 Tax=Oleiphilus messinensis TaxID=141451 RepID=A0A1Y0IC32_9GAMM|nr:mechanosensitive ion channel domain-containing protein [Oleiphilus messinensis]ARU58088.1 mechanosensitive ion channel MscS [Oleiphilus messinensis]